MNPNATAARQRISPWPVVRTLARFTVIESLRSRLFWLLGLILLVAFGAAMLAESVSLSESLASRLLVFGTLLRLGGVSLLTVLVVTSLAREAADRQLDFLLAGPCPRWAYALGKASGFALLAAGLAGAAGGLAWLLAIDAGGQVAAWAASLAVELLVVVALAMMVTLNFGQPAAALLALALIYGFARAAPAVVDMARYSVDMQHSLANQAQWWSAQALSWLVPPLDRLANADLLTGAAADPMTLLSACATTLAYAALYLLVALVDFSRRSLS